MCCFLLSLRRLTPREMSSVTGRRAAKGLRAARIKYLTIDESERQGALGAEEAEDVVLFC